MKKRPIVIISVLFLGMSFHAFASGTQETLPAPDTDGLNAIDAMNEDASFEVAPHKPSAVESLKVQFDAAIDSNQYAEAFSVWQNASAVLTVNAASKKDSDIVAKMQSQMDAFFSSLSFTALSTPAEVTNGKSFKTPFTVKLSSTVEGFNPESCPVLVEYPTLDENGNKVYAASTVMPTNDGTVSFTAPQTSFPYNGFVTFSLSFAKECADSFTSLPVARIPYRVQTNLKASGGSIAIVDLNKSGKAITSNSETSSAVLTALINKGFTRIGNSDFTQAVVAKNDAAVQKEAASLFQKSVTYLIYGTVSYEKSEKTENGYTTALKCELKVRNVLKNKELLSEVIVSEASDKTEWGSLNSARKKLAAEAAALIVYGM